MGFYTELENRATKELLNKAFVRNAMLAEYEYNYSYEYTECDETFNVLDTNHERLEIRKMKYWLADRFNEKLKRNS